MRVAIITTDGREGLPPVDWDKPSLGSAPAALVEGFALCPETEFHVISCARQAMNWPEKLADNTWFHSLKVPKLGWMRTFYQGCIRAVRHKLNEIQPDIVHGQGTERDCAISAAFSGYPNVVTIHGNMQAIAEHYHARFGNYYWLAAKLETLVLKRTEGAFCNSIYTEDQVRSRVRQVWRVANPVRLPFFETPVPSGVRPPVLLNIGTICDYKQQLPLLALAERLWRRGLRFEMIFIGGGDFQSAYGAEFLRRIEVAQKDGYARHLPFARLPQLISLMDGAAALVHFSVQESFGLVVAEALARNLKVFAGAAGGVPDVAQGVEAVELLPPWDFDGLESAVAIWLQAGCPRPVSAQQTMRQRYHPEVIARRHLEIYREVLSEA